MESLQGIITNLRISSSQRNFTDTTPTTYECDICKDTEVIYNRDTNSARNCTCVDSKKYKKLLEESGISKAFSSKTLENFDIKGKSKVIVYAKQLAKKYIETFDNTSSIAFLGKSGTGKTHLCIAIFNELLKKNIGVLYMQYREVITGIKQKITDEKAYSEELNKYKRAKVLFVDDLYKGKITESDVNIMFEIINYRYLNALPMLISSECNIAKLLTIDEAIGSRFVEMCKGFIVELEGKEFNHRLS